MRRLLRSLCRPLLIVETGWRRLLIALIIASSTSSYALGVGPFLSSDSRELLEIVGVAVVVIVLIVFRKLIARLVRLLFAFLLDMFFASLSVSAILFAAALINNYGITRLKSKASNVTYVRNVHLRCFETHPEPPPCHLVSSH